MEIKNFLKENHGYITTSELINMGISKPMIPSLIEKKVLRRVAQGIYIDYNTFEDEFYILQKRFSNIVFSYNTACYLWGLSDRAPYKMEVTTLSHNNINENIDIHYVNEKKFNIGVTTLTSPSGNPLIIYNQERCICDIIKNKNSVDAELYNKIIKNYFKQKNKNLERLEEYAKVFNIYEKVIDMMEVLM